MELKQYKKLTFKPCFLSKRITKHATGKIKSPINNLITYRAIFVASPRIERGSRASETLILSIVLRGRRQDKCVNMSICQFYSF